MMVGMLVLAQGTIGMIEASQTRNPSVPMTRAEGSVTARSSARAHATCARRVPVADHRRADPVAAGAVVVRKVVDRGRVRDQLVDHEAPQQRPSESISVAPVQVCTALTGECTAEPPRPVAVADRKPLLDGVLHRGIGLQLAHQARAEHEPLQVARRPSTC